MKKLLWLLATLSPVLFVSAQDDIVITGTKKITKQLTPQQVIDSLNKRFPDAESVQYYQPTSGIQNGWAVTEEDNLQAGSELDYYTISFKRNGLKYYGLYKKDGTLVQSKVEESVASLPEPIQNSIKEISKDHPGYTIVSKTYYKNQNYSKSKEYYEVIAEKGKVTKRLYYSADGILQKVKG